MAACNTSQSLLTDSRKRAPGKRRQGQELAWAFSRWEVSGGVVFAVMYGYLGFLSLIFIPKFYFLINGKRNHFELHFPDSLAAKIFRLDIFRG